MSLAGDGRDEASHAALFAGVGCYLLWGALPALFIVMGRAGATPWEIVGQRALWSAPWAAVLVLLAGQGSEALAVFTRPRVLGLLVLSTIVLTVNWTGYVWAVNNGRNLEASLGYYILPLLNMAAGALMFGERIDRFGAAAMALAAAGVALQTLALGHPPLISLVLAVSFGSYGLIRKQVDASAQTGLLIECLVMAGPGIAYAVWLHHAGGGIFARSLAGSLLMAAAGPATVAPLALFAWAARRLRFSTLGFLQFIGPTMGFFVGIATGESLTPMRAASFVFIWAGAAVFAFGAWRAMRRLQSAS